MNLRIILATIVVVYLGLGASSWIAYTSGSRNVAILLWAVAGLVLFGIAATFFYRRVLERGDSYSNN